ncbi:FAD-binding domain-containing protein [Rhizopogon salebrosus TDB-379]|nr:FAD-binding domain-containing protein [Rhizopogon salebrosus TDB-379]
MAPFAWLTFTSFLTALSVFRSSSSDDSPQVIFSVETCKEIAASVSSASRVYDEDSLHYIEDISHWASSSTQIAGCSFEPETSLDVGIALQILGKNRTPFAVKGGGHASNPGFSSTSGVQIAMSRFSDVTYDYVSQTATIGAGLIWDDVYAALEPYGVNVAGGRVSGVGVAGFILGGGYSWLTNQYGLAIDTVQSFELVMPCGTVKNVTATSDPDLFFGLRGGFNNFGIVTRFTLKAFPQPQVWGGLITYTSNELDRVNQATANFAANNTDPRAQIITTYNCILGLTEVSELLFYNGPSPPEGILDEFLAIPHLTKDVHTRSFSSLVRSFHANATENSRAIFNTVSVLDYPVWLLEAVVNESVFWGKSLEHSSAWFISYDVEPFLPSVFDHSSTPSAYPPNRDRALLPLNIYFAWIHGSSDGIMQEAARDSAAHLRQLAIAGGQDVADAASYSNYAIFDTPLGRIYGDNVPRLQAIKAAVDPTNVMGLAGGFKF